MRLKPFRFWCQHTLPAVYDDSLSYYELLCKVVDYLNEMGTTVNTLENNVSSISAQFATLKNYVDNYFSTLDIQDEINNKLDEMAESGELSELLNYFTAINCTVTTSRFVGETAEESTSYFVVDIPQKLTNGQNVKLSVGLSGGSLSALKTAGEFARDTASPLVINGGTFSTTTGQYNSPVIVDGNVIYNDPYNALNPYGYDAMYFDDSGVMHIVENGAGQTGEYLKSLGAYNSLGGFAGVVINGVAHDNALWYSVGNGAANPRTMLCQKQDGSLFVVVCGGRKLYSDYGMTYAQMGTLALNLGAYNAFCLDGGGSSQICVNGYTINRPIDTNGQIFRPVASFYYVQGNTQNAITAESLDRYNTQNLLELLRNYINYPANGAITLTAYDFSSVLQFANSHVSHRSGAIKVTSDSEMTFSLWPTDGDNTVIMRVYPINNQSNNRGIADGSGVLAHIYNAPTVISDCDTIIPYTGYTILRFNSSTVNSPINSSYGVIYRNWYSNTSISDFAVVHPSMTIYRRYYNGTGWTNWEIFPS